MHKWLASIAIVMVACAVAADAQRGRGGGGRQGGPPRPIAGSGIEVPGWAARLDDPSLINQPLRFVPMGDGMHATTGPSAIFWDEQQTASGNYTVKATFTLVKPPAAPEGYGLIIGATNLLEDTQRYTYFLIRGDGKYLIKKRNGSATNNVAGDWADSPAVAKADASGRSSNELSIRVSGGSVVFMANGKEVAKHPASAIDTEGVVGLRINHNLDVQIDGFAIEMG